MHRAAWDSQLDSHLDSCCSEVYQLVGTCSVPIDPTAVSDSNDVSVISSDPKSAGMKWLGWS